MTEKQISVINAFSDWLEKNGIAHLLMLNKEGHIVEVINGDRSDVGTGLTIGMIRNEELKNIVIGATRATAFIEGSHEFVELLKKGEDE